MLFSRGLNSIITAQVASLIEAEEKEKMFNEHILSLANKRKKAYRKLLDECEVVSNRAPPPSKDPPLTILPQQ